jgi:hypothetical protein
MEDVKREREFINREAWKYGALIKYKQPFYKTLLTKFFSGKKNIEDRQLLENEIVSQTKEKKKEVW